MRLWIGLGVSLVVHALAALLLLVLAGPVEQWAREQEPEPLAFVLIEPPTPPTPIVDDVAPPDPPPTPEPVREDPPPVEPPPEVAAARIPDERPPVRNNDPSPQPGSATPGPASEAPASVGPSTLEPPSVRDDRPRTLDPEEERRRMAALIDPTRVARSGFDFSGGAAPSQRGGPAGLGPPDRGPSEREIEQRLGTGLREHAMTKTHTARAPFVLRRRADGSQVWEGPRLTGIILPDGRVEFNDRPNVQTNGFSASGTFDATEAIMGASGQDPLRAEREYFMRQTEELRDRLEAEHRRREMERGLGTLRGSLARVWATTERTTSARRLRIFRMWDEADEDDGGGRRAREIILAFIRENLPAGSEDAYTEDEIRRFNARRESREEFRPY
jgi:hypothetical protein